MPYHEAALEFSPAKSSFGSPHQQFHPDFAQPLDYSTRKEKNLTQENPNQRMTTPESGVSSLSDGSPFRISPERDSSPRLIPNLLFGNHPNNHDYNLDRKMEDTCSRWNAYHTPGHPRESGNEVGTENRMAQSPRVPSILTHLQQTHPLLLSTLYNIASQQVAEATTAGSQPVSIPHVQANPAPKVPPMMTAPFMKMPIGSIPDPFSAALPSVDLLHGPHIGDIENESLTLKSNESYLKFRAQMIAKGQIGTKPRRGHTRNVFGRPQRGDHASSDDGSEKGDKETKDDPSDHFQQAAFSDGFHKETVKNAAYYERRKKNNEAAKRSRDARRAKEDEIAIRAAFLEAENLQLRNQVVELKVLIRRLHQIQSNL